MSRASNPFIRKARPGYCPYSRRHTMMHLNNINAARRRRPISDYHDSWARRRGHVTEMGLPNGICIDLPSLVNADRPDQIGRIKSVGSACASVPGTQQIIRTMKFRYTQWPYTDNVTADGRQINTRNT